MIVNKVYKFYIDFGSGYVELTEEYAMTGPFVLANDINPAIYRLRNEFNLLLTAENYISVKALLANNVELPYKVEVKDNVGAYNTLNEGTCDIRTVDNAEMQQLSIDVFNVVDNVAQVINVIDSEFNIVTDTPIQQNEIRLKYTAVILQNIQVCYDNTATSYQYTLDYNTSGTPSDGTVTNRDPRWDYFEFTTVIPGTCGTGDGFFIFNTVQGLSVDGGFEPIDWYGRTIYVALPSVVGVSVDERVTLGALKIEQTLNYLIKKANSSFLFDDFGITYSGINILDYYIVMKSLIISNSQSDSTVSLANMFEFMQNTFGLLWYMDGITLKFKHYTELIKTPAGLDLSTKDIGKRVFTYFETIPISEKWSVPDSFTLDFTIGSIDYDTNSKQREAYNVPFSTDYAYLSNNRDLINSSGFIALNAPDDGTDNALEVGAAIAESGNIINPSLSIHYCLLNHLNNYRPFKTGTINGVTTALNATISKPVKSQVIVSDEYIDFNAIDTEAYIKTGLGDEGILSSVSIDTDTRKGGTTTYLINFAD